jgi:hypothetical protein
VLPVRADDRQPRLSDPEVLHNSSRSASTRYLIEDPYGNPILEGYVVVRSAFPGSVQNVDQPVVPGPSGSSVWVNFTAVGDGAGTVQVLSAYGLPLLAPRPVPAVSAGASGLTDLALLAGAVTLVVAATVLHLRYRRRPERAPVDVGEAELERYAAGRAHVLTRLAGGPVEAEADLSGAWSGPAPSPTPSEITEWLTTLIAEGTVLAQNGPDGRPEFLRADAAEVRAELELDDAALERALARRDARESPTSSGAP